MVEYRIKIHEKSSKNKINHISFHDEVFLWAFRSADKETIRLTGLVELGEESILPPLLLQLLEHLALACHLAASFQTSRIWKQAIIYALMPHLHFYILRGNWLCAVVHSLLHCLIHRQIYLHKITQV